MEITQKGLIELQRKLESRVTEGRYNDYKKLNLYEYNGTLKISKNKEEGFYGLGLTLGDFYKEDRVRLTQKEVREIIYRKIRMALSKKEEKLFELEGVRLEGLVKFFGHEGEELLQTRVKYHGEDVGYVSEDSHGGPMAINLRHDVREKVEKIVSKLKGDRCVFDDEIFWFDLLNAYEYIKQGKTFVIVRKEKWREQIFTINVPKLTPIGVSNIYKYFKDKGELKGVEGIKMIGKNQKGNFVFYEKELKGE